MGKIRRRQVTETVFTFSAYDLDGSVTEAIEWLENIGNEHGGEARLDFDGYDCTEYSIDVTRDETDAELNRRQKAHDRMLEAQAQRETAQEARDMETYQRIKAKIEGGDG